MRSEIFQRRPTFQLVAVINVEESLLQRYFSETCNDNLLHKGAQYSQQKILTLNLRCDTGGSAYGTPRKVNTVTLFLRGTGLGSGRSRSDGISSKGSRLAVHGTFSTTTFLPTISPMDSRTITSSFLN